MTLQAFFLFFYYYVPTALQNSCISNSMIMYRPDLVERTAPERRDGPSFPRTLDRLGPSRPKPDSMRFVK